MNLLLWGAKKWSLRMSQLNQLEVFLHDRSIRRILQISMSTVKKEKIGTREYVRCFILSHAYEI